jgi:hypothetical protein
VLIARKSEGVCIAAATTDGWDHAILRREQLHNDAGPVLHEVELGQHPEQKVVASQSHVQELLGSVELPSSERWHSGTPLGVSQQ